MSAEARTKLTLNHTGGDAAPTVLTIGHSTRASGEFLRLLKAHSVTCVVDVRTIPRSRYNPQFNREALAKSLKVAGVGYLSMPGLGGLRRPQRDSLNTGWRNDSFRGFADYMQTLEFEASLKELSTIARYERIALLCAEAVPWRCHRSLIADALLARGIPVEHILSGPRRQIHSMTPFAQVRGTSIVYPAERKIRTTPKKSSPPRRPGGVRRKRATKRAARKAISSRRSRVVPRR